MEEVDVQDTEAGIRTGVQGTCGKAGEVRAHDWDLCTGAGSGRTDPAQLGKRGQAREAQLPDLNEIGVTELSSSHDNQ